MIVRTKMKKIKSMEGKVLLIGKTKEKLLISTK